MKAFSTTPLLLLLACQARPLGTGRAQLHDGGPSPDGRSIGDEGCGDLQTDRNNCGKCGNVCSAIDPSTAECATGRCLTTLTSREWVPRIVVASDGVYWLNSLTRSDGGTATILWTIGLDGGSPIGRRDVACGLGGDWTGPLAVGATNLYCVGPGEGARVAKMPLDGSSWPAFFTGGNWFEIYDLAVDASNVYWSSCYKDSYIFTAPVAGKADPFQVGWGQGSVCPSNLVLDGANLYWLGASVPTNGTAEVGLMKISKTDDRAEPVLLTKWAKGWGRFAVGSAAIYWADPDRGSLMAVPIDGGASPSAVVTGLDSPRDVAVDGNRVYWTSYEGGQVMRLSLDNGSVTVLASNQSRPHGTVIDATSVYWISTYGGVDTIMKLTPK
jgi:hypothetical protein